MNLMDTMYKAWVQMNEWALLSSEQEEIVARNAKIAQLEQANKPKCKTKEDNKSKMKVKDNKTNDHNWMKEKPTRMVIPMASSGAMVTTYSGITQQRA